MSDGFLTLSNTLDEKVVAPAALSRVLHPYFTLPPPYSLLVYSAGE